MTDQMSSHTHLITVPKTVKTTSSIQKKSVAFPEESIVPASNHFHPSHTNPIPITTATPANGNEDFQELRKLKEK